MPRPSQVSEIFWKKYSNSPKEATDFYYDFSTKTNYIRKSRVEKDLKWTVPSQYGEIDITVNLSKPEKILKLLQPQEKLLHLLIRSVSFVWKMKAMQVV